MSEYRLRIGNVGIALLFETERDSRATGRYFGRPSCSEDADIRLSIRFREDRGDGRAVPSSLFLTKTGDGNGFSMGGGLVEGRFSPSSGEGELAVRRLITRGGYARVYEQVFYQAYASAARRKGIDSFLLHSSGVVRRGRGYAFAGRSGSGKSTVARLSKGMTVLNDEITVIDLSNPDPVLHGTPFNGFFRGKEEGSAPLACVLLLEQGPAHQLSPAGGLEDVKSLSREVIPPIGLEDPFSPASFMEMFDRAEGIRSRIPLYRLEFKKDPGFWDCIDAREGA